MTTNNSGDTSDDKTKREAQKKLVEELKGEWKLMWSERFDDKAKAEGVSIANYSSLQVERGTIIHATKDFKALNFREILEQHLVENPDRYVEPSNSVGGWNKFIKTKITSDTSVKRRRTAHNETEKTTRKQPKKSGRGWLHTE